PLQQSKLAVQDPREKEFTLSRLMLTSSSKLGVRDGERDGATNGFSKGLAPIDIFFEWPSSDPEA
ncbi:hypothetical protein GCK32_013735, partial [Trichostrongylus colubriformis]